MDANKITDHRTPEQHANLRRLNHATKVRQIAQNNGGTAELRPELSAAQAGRLKAKRRQAKYSRKANRSNR